MARRGLHGDGKAVCRTEGGGGQAMQMHWSSKQGGGMEGRGRGKGRACTRRGVVGQEQGRAGREEGQGEARHSGKGFGRVRKCTGGGGARGRQGEQKGSGDREEALRGRRGWACVNERLIDGERTHALHPRLRGEQQPLRRCKHMHCRMRSPANGVTLSDVKAALQLHGSIVRAIPRCRFARPLRPP